MNLLLPIFNTVSVIFAGSAIMTGIQAIVDPVNFSRTSGLPITTLQDTATSIPSSISPTTSYVSLIGVRQLATGITVLTFTY